MFNDCDDGEFYLEYCQLESLIFDDGWLKNVSFDVSQGFGLWVVVDEVFGYVYFLDFLEDVVKCVLDVVQVVKKGYFGVLVDGFVKINVKLYVDENFL